MLLMYRTTVLIFFFKKTRMVLLSVYLSLVPPNTESPVSYEFSVALTFSDADPALLSRSDTLSE